MNPIPVSLPSHRGGGLRSPAPAKRWRQTPCERLHDPESGDSQVLAESWQPPPPLPPPSPTPHPSPGATAEVGVGGTGLVFWNSCSRRWARLECGNRLRTRTFMETCWWSRRRRRRQPEGSQRPERQRRRPERPDPRPHPSAGRAQPLGAHRGPQLVAGSWRVRGVGERGAGAEAADREGSGPPPGRGPRGDAPPSRLPARLRRSTRARGAAASWGGAPGPARPADSAEWRPGSARLTARTGLWLRRPFPRPPPLLRAPRPGSPELRSGACSTPAGKSPARAAWVQSLRSALGVQAGIKFSVVPHPPRAPGAVSIPRCLLFLREIFSWSAPAEAGE